PCRRAEPEEGPMTQQAEKRHAGARAGRPALVRSRRDDSGNSGPGTIVGYAAVFYSATDPGTEYVLADWSDECVVEQIAPGAFDRALKDQDDVRALFNHNADYVLGRTASGTLRMTEDDKGLRYEADLPDTTVARDLAAMVERGDINGSSFAFAVEAE